MQYTNVGKLDVTKLGKYKDKIMTDQVILTSERLNQHILVKHFEEYEQLKLYLESIIKDPDFILKDNKNKDTIILLKKIDAINVNGRVVIRMLIGENQKRPKNSIITLMKLNDRTWKQTLKNRGNIIFKKARQK